VTSPRRRGWQTQWGWGLTIHHIFGTAGRRSSTQSHGAPASRRRRAAVPAAAVESTRGVGWCAGSRTLRTEHHAGRCATSRGTGTTRPPQDRRERSTAERKGGVYLADEAQTAIVMGSGATSLCPAAGMRCRRDSPSARRRVSRAAVVPERDGSCCRRDAGTPPARCRRSIPLRRARVGRLNAEM
jgi:hypothetical protein